MYLYNNPLLQPSIRERLWKRLMSMSVHCKKLNWFSPHMFSRNSSLVHQNLIFPPVSSNPLSQGTGCITTHESTMYSALYRTELSLSLWLMQLLMLINSRALDWSTSFSLKNVLVSLFVLFFVFCLLFPIFLLSKHSFWLSNFYFVAPHELHLWVWNHSHSQYKHCGMTIRKESESTYSHRRMRWEKIYIKITLYYGTGSNL